MATSSSVVRRVPPPPLTAIFAALALLLSACGDSPLPTELHTGPGEATADSLPRDLFLVVHPDGGTIVPQSCERQDGGGGGVQVQGESGCCVGEGEIPCLPPIVVEACPEGMSKSEDGETCVCDNGSEEEDCWLDPDDPWEDCDPDFEEECVPCNPNFEDCAPGGGGGNGGSDDGGDGGTDFGTFGYDEDPHLPMMPPPDCDADELREGEQAWCSGRPLLAHEVSMVNGHANKIIERCNDLADDYNRVRHNIRIHRQDDFPNVGGYGSVGGDWMTISDGWFNHDLELAIAHELIHISGKMHGKTRGTNQWNDFVAKEKQCSGGRSAYDP